MQASPALKPIEEMFTSASTLVVRGVVEAVVAGDGDVADSYRVRVEEVFAGSSRVGARLKFRAAHCTASSLERAVQISASKKIKAPLVALQRTRDGWQCRATHRSAQRGYWLHTNDMAELLELRLPPTIEEGPLVAELERIRRRAESSKARFIEEAEAALARQGCTLMEAGEVRLLLWPDGQRALISGLAAREDWASGPPPDAQPCLKAAFIELPRAASFDGGSMQLSLSVGAPPALRSCDVLCHSWLNPWLPTPELPMAPRPDEAPAEEWRCYVEGLVVDSGADVAALHQQLYCALFVVELDAASRLIDAIPDAQRAPALLIARVLAARPQTAEALRSAWREQLGAMSDREILWMLSSPRLPPLLALSPLRLHALAMMWSSVYPEPRGRPLSLLYIARALAPEAERAWLNDAAQELERSSDSLRIALANEDSRELISQHIATSDAVSPKRQASQPEAAPDAEAASGPAAAAASRVVAPAAPERGLREALIVAIAIASLIATALLIHRTSR
jgi:hypothetical protein